MQQSGIKSNAKRLTAVLILTAAGLCATGLRAQSRYGSYSGGTTVNLTQPQKLKFYFVMGSSDLVFHYGPNLMQRQQFDSLAKRVAVLRTARFDSVVVTAYTSSEDSRIGSRELAEARIAAVKDYVIRTLEHNELEGIAILSQIRPAEDETDEEAVGGDDDPWLAGDDIYNKVRRVEFTAYLNAAQGYGPAVRMEEQFGVTPELTELLADTISEAQRERQRAAIVTNPYPVWQPGGAHRQQKIRSYAVRDRYTGPIDQVVSLRTNIPYWLMLAPNGGIEFHIGGHFSILLEGAVTYWNKKNDTGDKGIYVAGGGPEFRYWFGDDRSEAGHVVGLYGQYADFDIKLNEKGRQGTAIGGGISYGYYMPVGRRWAFEFGIGLGYLSNKMDVYKWNPVVKKNLWMEHKTKAWIGPTKVNATVIFRIGHK
ncbi:DUF3575 domain-containing protein [Rikenella microfusus]|uniref:Protein of uncharacterized function (DUF3575) n=1 Tax=Rikenella microfusus TaxID=28139 RepID=A0A379MTV5_9BACT|nr:DUF3575 domain-containing protein [Rikenella microfusus]SUE34052.1 Protein of uncharacterised function (DUF3575) [Rikenella microfusus]